MYLPLGRPSSTRGRSETFLLLQIYSSPPTFLENRPLGRGVPVEIPTLYFRHTNPVESTAPLLRPDSESVSQGFTRVTVSGSLCQGKSFVHYRVTPLL